MAHKITIQELDLYKKAHWTRFASSFGRGCNKTLEFNAVGLYQVCQAGCLIYSGPSKETAVREYNDLA